MSLNPTKTHFSSSNIVEDRDDDVRERKVWWRIRQSDDLSKFEQSCCIKQLPLAQEFSEIHRRLVSRIPAFIRNGAISDTTKCLHMGVGRKSANVQKRRRVNESTVFKRMKTLFQSNHTFLLFSITR
jgi:hypothetical protein